MSLWNHVFHGSSPGRPPSPDRPISTPLYKAARLLGLNHLVPDNSDGSFKVTAGFAAQAEIIEELARRVVALEQFVREFEKAGEQAEQIIFGGSRNAGDR